jgi:hypothetical protein
MTNNYKTIRERVKNGDVLVVQGKGFVSGLIRVLTGESYSHVGMLLWMDKGLFVAEYKEFKGFQIVPASTWVSSVLEAGDTPYFGKSPQIVSSSSQSVFDEALDFRKKPYGYLSLIKVWASQITRWKIKTRRFVCSTFVQYVWAKAGYNIKGTADPGDIASHVNYLSRIDSL